MQEKAVSKDGTPIAYWISGRGPPLVLVHGTTADHTRWDPVRALLEPHATLYALDRRGRGASGDVEPYALEREYEDVAAVVDAAAARAGAPVVLFGHSYGAVCSLGAARLTRNIRKLVLYEPVVLPGASPVGFAQHAASLLAQERRGDVIELFFREVLRLPKDEIERMRAQPSWQMRVAAAHTLLREDGAEASLRFDPAALRGVGAPTLMLLGTDSPAFLRASTDAVAAALPNVRIAALAGQQHMAISTAPQLVADAVVPFLTTAT